MRVRAIGFVFAVIFTVCGFLCLTSRPSPGRTSRRTQTGKNPARSRDRGHRSALSTGAAGQRSRLFHQARTHSEPQHPERHRIGAGSDFGPGGYLSRRHRDDPRQRRRFGFDLYRRVGGPQHAGVVRPKRLDHLRRLCAASRWRRRRSAPSAKSPCAKPPKSAAWKSAKTSSCCTTKVRRTRCRLF